MVNLLPFQNRFVRAVENPKYDTVALSGPRGLGKTFLAGHILARAMTPGDPLHQPGREYILGAASLEQARMTYQYVRAALEHTGEYRWIDSTTRLGATHVASNTKLRAISSNGKTAFGLVNVPMVVIDEPGALEIVGGQMLADAVFTAQGKVGSALKVVMIGTLAPMAGDSGHWWHQLATGGTHGSVWASLFQGDAGQWDDWGTIKKANPLTRISPSFGLKLRQERDAALAEPRLKARFLSYRLNLPTADESSMLLSVPDWESVLSRPAGARDGQPVVGIDLGAGRAFSAAVAMWRSGRIEAMGVAPGIPDLASQERRDRVPAGTYAALVAGGALEIAHGLRVQPPGQLMAAVVERWGQPIFMCGDRFREAEMRDVSDVEFDARVTRWSESSADIRALRRMCLDGPLSVAEDSAALLTASLAVAMVQNDDAGNSRMVKRGNNNQARDDVAAALVLVAGAVDRHKPFAESATPAYSGMIPL